MAASTQTTEYSVKEAVAYLLISDSAGALPVYGKGKKIPGIVNVSLTENSTITPIPGDGGIIDTQSEPESVELSIEYNKKSHELEQLIKGGIHRLLASESQLVRGGSDQAAKIAMVFRCTKLSAGSNKDVMLHVFNMSVGSTSGAYANKEAKSNSFDAQASQIEGKILHSDGNDIYVDRIRNTAEAIDYDTPLPPLPASTAKTTIASISVADGDDDVAVDEAFTVTFSSAIDSDFINSNYFYIRNNATGALVAATVAQASPPAVTVTPDSNLSNSASYTLIVDKNVADATNNMPTNDPRAISFTVVGA